VVIVVAGLWWGQTKSGAPLAEGQEAVTVAVGDFFFCDPSLAPGACQTVVRAGDTITWEYRTGGEGHTVTDCGESCDTPTDTPLWDSGGLTAGQTFSYTFAAPGTYRYLCRFHPDAMRAEVLVEPAPTVVATPPAASPTPTPTVEVSPTPTPTEAARSPTSEPSPTATPSASTPEDDDDTSSWVLILVGVGGGLVLLAGGVWAVRRFR
jgi:cell division septation protein DedD